MSGLSHLPAKEAYLKYGTEGSNPSLSARLHNVMKIRTYHFGFWCTIHEEVNMLEKTGGHHRVIDFVKSVRIPDVDERTNNDPCYLMSSNDVLKLIKGMYAEGCDASGGKEEGSTRAIILNHQTSGKEVITEYMVRGIIKEATVHYGWSEVKLIGKQLLFIK